MELKPKKIKKPKKVTKDLYDLMPKEYIALSETAHAKYIHSELDKMGILHTHTPNESGQAGTINIIIMMSNKKKMGVSPGYPDFSIYIPFKEGYVSAQIELKKAKGVKGGDNGSHISDQQAHWLNHLQKVPLNYVYVAWGAIELLSIVKSLQHDIEHLNTDSVLAHWKQKQFTDYVPLITLVKNKESTKPTSPLRASL